MSYTTPQSELTTSSLIDRESNAPLAPVYLYGAPRYATAIGLYLALFISLMDTTIVAVALPKIGGDLHGYDRANWVVTAYLITYVAFLPIFSKIADVTSPKYVLVTTCLLFVAFSGACGGATTLTELIIFRALQGIGGSALWSCSTMAIFTMLPPEIVPKYVSLIGVTYAMASSLGPILGGVISQHIDWAWIFYINLPLGAISALLMIVFMHGPGLKTLSWTIVRRRVDWLGASLLFASLLLLCVALQLGGGPQYTWANGAVLGPLIVSIVLIPAILWTQRKSNEPIMPLALFKLHPNIVLYLIIMIGVGAGFFAAVVWLPQRMQVVDGVSAQTAGIRTLPMLASVGIAGALAPPIIVRTQSYRPMLLASIILGAVSGGLISTLGSPTNYKANYPYEVLIGLASGAAISITTVTFQLPVPLPNIPVALGFCSTARMLGALLGISTAATILNTFVRHRLKTHASLSPALIDAIMKAPDLVARTLPGDDAALVRKAYADGYHWVFVSIAIWWALEVIPALFLVHLQLPSGKREPASHPAISLDNLSANTDTAEGVVRFRRFNTS